MKPAHSRGTHLSPGSAKTVPLTARKGGAIPKSTDGDFQTRLELCGPTNQPPERGPISAKFKQKHFQSFHGIGGHIGVLRFPGVLYHSQATCVVHRTKSVGSFFHESG
jgi:hypothetical protein